MEALALAWHTTCSSLCNIKEIGFPGWPDPNLDSVSGFWGVNYKKGACTSPLFHLVPHSANRISPPAAGVSVPRLNNQAAADQTLTWPDNTFNFIALGSSNLLCSHGFCGFVKPKKDERPVGGPAARAWGWRETQSEVSSVLPAVLLRSRAAVRQTGAVSTTPQAATNSRSQLRLCSRHLCRSIARSFHRPRYFPRHASVLFCRYLRTLAGERELQRSPCACLRSLVSSL